MNLEQKYQALQNSLRRLGKVIIAYSGGVDSTFLLKVAVDTLSPESVLACIGISPSLARSQYDQAIQNAKLIGANVKEVQLDELSDPNYSANNPDRCFHCKSTLFRALTEIAREQNFHHILYGSNLDDKSDFRPGSRAAKAFNVLPPLMDASMTKQDIRDLSHRLDLPTASLPASPCLASRIPYGLKVTEQRLSQVEQAEQLLSSLGLSEFRVRHHDNLARIEARPEDIKKITAEPARSQIIEKLKAIGFKFITIDLQGFRSGALNEALTEEQKKENL